MKIDNTDFDVKTVKSMSKENFCKAFGFLYPNLDAKGKERRLVEIYGELTKSELEKSKVEPKADTKAE